MNKYFSIRPNILYFFLTALIFISFSLTVITLSTLIEYQKTLIMSIFISEICAAISLLMIFFHKEKLVPAIVFLSVCLLMIFYSCVMLYRSL